MNKLGAAIVGCGSISGVHLKALSGLELAELKLVVDTDEELAKRTAEQYGCEYTTDYKELFGRSDVQVVHLCTPHFLHSPMAVELLAAGKHVLTEKPMAENKAAAARLIEAAENSQDAQLGVIFQNRYNPASQLLKQYVDQNRLGKLLCMKGLVTWFRDAGYYKTAWKGKWATEGGGVLINQAIHTLDLIQWLGGEISSIKGSVSTDSLEGVIEVEDSAHALIRFTSGARAIFYATNAYLKNSPVELEVVFEQGTLYMRGDYLYLQQDGEETLLCEPAVNDLGEKSYWGVSHTVQIRDFYEHVLAGNKFWIDAREGVKAVNIVMDIYESSRLQKEVPFAVTLS
ncbi:Gfo/Idh/MocA family oxidoreductase [Paenibacillus thalictri]|uniref:Gfo/Idh/MocA family oxidoreductase n=2 Tax=Paenibacillus thalictri TaxID=2527873 RepID=A0A4Q9DG02_9BACL|nr:Gfo/Idh/MocA family oxidoreductase [Paenibacillus thalictri]